MEPSRPDTEDLLGDFFYANQDYDFSQDLAWPSVDDIDAFGLGMVPPADPLSWPLSSAHPFSPVPVSRLLEPPLAYGFDGGRIDSPITFSPLDPSPTQTSSSSSPKRPYQDRDADEDRLLKRQRNNVAARKYRQKKVDRIKELEEEVDDIKRERDDLRIRLARQEAETAALREMLRLGNPGMAGGR